MVSEKWDPHMGQHTAFTWMPTACRFGQYPPWKKWGNNPVNKWPDEVLIFLLFHEMRNLLKLIRAEWLDEALSHLLGKQVHNQTDRSVCVKQWYWWEQGENERKRNTTVHACKPQQLFSCMYSNEVSFIKWQNTWSVSFPFCTRARSR